MEHDHRPSVCVIGAGVSGLAAAKVLSRDGFDVDIYERSSRLGGTWNPDRTYPDLRTNDPGDAYRFPGHPYPDDADEYPTASQVYEYLRSYAERFELLDRIRFDTEVAHVERVAGAGGSTSFDVRIEADDLDARAATESYDYVVICNGAFCEPHIPEIDGAERFGGAQLHSCELSTRETIADERVVVVGGGKSAYDCAEIAAKYGRSCNLVFRRPHWLAPRKMAGMRSDWLVLSRVAQAFMPYPTRRGLGAALHGPGRPLVRLYWWLQTKLLAFLFDAPDALEPETPLPQGFQNIGAGTGLFDKVRDGSVEPVRGEIDEIVDDETIAITNGERLEADVIIYATGWEHPVDMLAPELQDLVLDDEFFTLYRHIMPPEVPNMGFVGYASSIGTAMTSALSAHWLSAHFRDQVDLPSTERMYEHIDEVREWTEEYVPGSPNGHLLGVAIVPFYDALLRDMGVSTHQADHLIEEYLGRYHAERFAGLAAQA